MTAIAAISLLAAVVLYVTGNHYRNRAANLETLLQFEREQFNDLVLSLDEHELLRQLDDTCRELAHVRHLHSTLLEENTTLCVDLAYSEKLVAYYRTLYRRTEPVRFVMAGEMPRKAWRPL